MEKVFKTLDEQIQLLKSRNILIEDYNKTYKILEKNNYYYLINGYKDLFLNHKYKNLNKMIVHYWDNYHYIPLWVLVRILSFGKISKFYSLMKQKEQNTISRKFNLQISEFKIYLQNLTLIRNICAHDEKLYDITLKNRIYPTKYHKKLNIIKNDKFLYATRDLFSIIIILKILLEKVEFYNFYINIIKNIDILQTELITISINKVLYKMGFPDDYKKLLYL